MKLEQLPIGSFYLVGDRGLKQVNLDSQTCLALTARSSTDLLSKDLQEWSREAKHLESIKLNEEESLVALDLQQIREPQEGVPASGRVRYFAVSPAGRFVEINMDSKSCMALTSQLHTGTVNTDLHTWGLRAGHGAALPIRDQYAISIVALDVESLKLGIHQHEEELAFA
jgi:hypothetical protein